MDILEQPGPANGAAIIIATKGRARIVSSLVHDLGRQSRPPDRIFVIASQADDIAGLQHTPPNVTIKIGRTGSCHQRNDGLALAGDRYAYIVFFDDDFIPSRFWIERMLQLFAARPDIAGVTGTILADGTTTAGIALEEAQAILAKREAAPAPSRVHEVFAYGGNMGCNMAFRYSAIRDITFDERLPLYAWMEDLDFRGQVSRQGRIVRAEALFGVHLGHKQGRGRGILLGYSQIANPVYLARKGTVPKSFLAAQMLKNIASNSVRALMPEPFVDRRGRLKGNLIALADMVRGRMAPERILSL